MKYLISSLLFLTVIFQSCSIEKRHYTSGYHLQWKKGTNSECKVQYTEPQTQNLLTASTEKKKAIVILSSDSIKCDTLIMKDGTEVKAKVLEVTPTEVKYKFCNNINGPLYVAYRYNLSYIKYANGTIDSFVSEHPPLANQPANRNNVPNDLNNGGYNQNNGGAFNGNNNHPSMNGYIENDYVRRLSITSLVCGIVSFAISFFGIITAIVALTSGYKALRLINNDPSNLWMYRARTMAGIILGWIFIGIILLTIIALIIIFSI